MKSQPVVRHEFTTLKDMNETSLWYLASNESTHVYIDSIIKPEQSVNGLIYDKIDLPDVKLLRPPYTRSFIPELFVAHHPTEATRASIRVIFERDIFYFNCRRCSLMYKDWIGNGSVLYKWGALTHPTSDLLQAHDWIVNVQKLALLNPPPDDDFGVLTRMADLKTVYIVIKEVEGIYALEIAIRRFVEIETFKQYCTVPVDVENGERARDNLMNLFAKHDMKVEVKLMVDSGSYELQH